MHARILFGTGRWLASKNNFTFTINLSRRSGWLYHTNYIQDSSAILLRVLPSCIVSLMKCTGSFMTIERSRQRYISYSPYVPVPFRTTPCSQLTTITANSVYGSRCNITLVTDRIPEHG